MIIPDKVDGELLSLEVIDLIRRLCCDAQDRLGCNGADEIKEQQFFKTIDFEGGLRNQKAPYIPLIRYATDTSNFDDVPAPPWLSDSDQYDEEGGVEGDIQFGNGYYPNNGAGNVKPPKNMKDKDKSGEVEHAFFEFTFRRFFDASGNAYQFTKLTNDSACRPDNNNNESNSVAGVQPSMPGQTVGPLESATTSDSESVSGSDLYEQVASSVAASKQLKSTTTTPTAVISPSMPTVSAIPAKVQVVASKDQAVDSSQTLGMKPDQPPSLSASKAPLSSTTTTKVTKISDKASVVELKVSENSANGDDDNDPVFV